MAARSGGLRSLRYPQLFAVALRRAGIARPRAGISGSAVVDSRWLARRFLALAEPALIARDGDGGLVRADIFIRNT
jgi:hypothetical protein